MSFPIRVRLTVWHVVFLAATLLALAAFLLLRLKADLISGLDQSLDSRAAQISLGYEGGTEKEFQDVSDASPAGIIRGEHAAQVLSSRGEVLESSGDTVAEAPMIRPESLATILGGQLVRETRSLGRDREHFRLLAVPGPGKQVFVVATSLEEIDHSVHRLFTLFLVAGPAALAVAAVLGWLLIRKALLPVARMTEKAREIEVDRLGDRLAVPKARDELGRLAHTLNDMLDRLERGVEEKRRFVADASHELRTPLAIMRSELDVSMRGTDLPAAARGVLESAAEEVERMSRTVENLLTLAHLDEGKLRLLTEAVDLHDVAETVVDALRPLAARRGIRLQLDGMHVHFLGDRDRLYQAVVNVVENAIKYTKRHGEVRVGVWERTGDVGLAVMDTGPGIPTELLPRIFDRFVRVDSARSQSEGGSGLGLAICREIVEAHGGRVWVESELGRGSRFFLAFRASSAGRETRRNPAPSTAS